MTKDWTREELEAEGITNLVSREVEGLNWTTWTEWTGKFDGVDIVVQRSFVFVGGPIGKGIPVFVHDDGRIGLDPDANVGVTKLRDAIVDAKATYLYVSRIRARRRRAERRLAARKLRRA